MLSDLKLLVVGVPSANVQPACLRLEGGQSVWSRSFLPGDTTACVRKETAWQLETGEADPAQECLPACLPALSASALTRLAPKVHYLLPTCRPAQSLKGAPSPQCKPSL